MKNFKKVKITMLFLLILCVISVIAVISRNIYFLNSSKEKIKEAREIFYNTNTQEEIVVEDDIIDGKEVEKDEDMIFQGNIIGMIIIPKLNIEAPICEGTSADVLKNYIRAF